MRTLLLGFSALCLLANAASTQRLAAYDPQGSLIAELQPPTALLPGANPPLIIYTTVPALPPPIPSFPMPGDSTYDNAIGLHWFTEGFTLAAMPTPAYPPLGPVPGPFPIPPAVIAAMGGPATGIALDPAAGIMWMVSGPGMVVGVTPAVGLPIVVQPFPVPWLMGAVAGLEWDGFTGSLWALDTGFFAYNFLPGGGPISLPIMPLGALPGLPGDIAIDKLGSANPAGFRPLYISGGGTIVDMLDPAGFAWPCGLSGDGLAFMDHPAEVPPLPGCAGCPGITTGPTAFTTSVMSSGNGAFTVGMGGLTPGVGFGIFAFDTVTSPFPFPLINGPTACPLGLTLSPTLILSIAGPANALGDVFLPVSLLTVPAGLFLHNQNFTFCPALPTGLAFSRFQTITSGVF